MVTRTRGRQVLHSIDSATDVESQSDSHSVRVRSRSPGRGTEEPVANVGNSIALPAAWLVEHHGGDTDGPQMPSLAEGGSQPHGSPSVDDGEQTLSVKRGRQVLAQYRSESSQRHPAHVIHSADMTAVDESQGMPTVPNGVSPLLGHPSTSTPSHTNKPMASIGSISSISHIKRPSDAVVPSVDSTFHRNLLAANRGRPAIPHKLTDAEKRAMIENLEFEVNDRVQRLRSNDKWLQESLKLRCELDLSVFPKDVRNLTMKDFCLHYNGSINEYMHQQASQRIRAFKLPVTPDIIKKRKFMESSLGPRIAQPALVRPVAHGARVPPASHRNPASQLPAPPSVRRPLAKLPPSQLPIPTPATRRIHRIAGISQTPAGSKSAIRPPTLPLFSPKLSKSPYLKKLKVTTPIKVTDINQNLQDPTGSSTNMPPKLTIVKGRPPRAIGKKGAVRITRKVVKPKSSAKSLADEQPTKRRRRSTVSKENVPPTSATPTDWENGPPTLPNDPTEKIDRTDSVRRSKRSSVGSNKTTGTTTSNAPESQPGSAASTISKASTSSKRTSSGHRAADRAALALYTKDKGKPKLKSGRGSSGTKVARSNSRK
ncbi:hypothetical protein BJ085DRAFT_32352 [Dimargaris cristalligena]|uniref:Borealin N-terminal domain-containing protein n=1 Tax=Dimargaris cristalligena TaxID=215637 RepID=A0A4P9ZW10_9FUNG|nr:hypothetical protein BJ085DRAFT_32352 [Dimargaris cristalligena]|eukprot:RKP36850.1 hypothetical protein BJ085DRAFT_32352 [Dimargaris cristalligena]